MTASALYRGTITHGRRGHAFSYALHMLYLDLDELPVLRLGPWFGVERCRPLSFRRRDYLGESGSLRACVQDEVERALGTRPGGPIRMLTHVRTCGYTFNPVTFYYCFDDAGAVAAVVAQITNTPWNERHTYVVPGGGGELDKRFHVSPFFPMTHRYRWKFSPPGARLTVDMDNEHAAATVFRARLELLRHELTAGTLAAASFAQPLMAWRVHAAIYWQALRLFMKGAHVHPHPGRPAP